MLTSATSRRTPAETKAYLTRSFDGFQGNDIFPENPMRGGGSGGREEERGRLRGGGGGLRGQGAGEVGLGRDIIRRPTPAFYDPWNDDIVSSRTDDQRSLKYIHTTNYPDKLLMRRARSAASLHSLNGSYNESPNYLTGRNSAAGVTHDLKAPKVTLRTADRQTQTTVDRYTQTPMILAPNERNTYYQQMLSTLNRRSPFADFAPMVRPGDVRQLESFVMQHGPAVYRYGGKGAPWRHLKRTCGISGENIMFVDGEVKEYDSRFFPLPSARRIEPEVPGVYFRRPASVIQY